MSIATAPPPIQAKPRLLTCADLDALPEDLPTGRVHYELDNGRLIVMAPPGADHGSKQSLFCSELRVQGELKGLGRAFAEVGVVLWRNPDRVVGPDAAFIAKYQYPVRTSPEGYLETLPDLVVEIRSKNDTLDELAAKVADYLKAGVRLVWVADPFAKIVTAYRAEMEPQVLGLNDVLTAGDIIPDFRLPVSDVFRE